MSIEVTNCFGLGWIMPKEKYDEMRSIAEERGLWGDIEDCFRYVNCCCADVVFLGEMICYPQEGDHIDLVKMIQEVSENMDSVEFAGRYVEIIEDACGQSISGPDSPWSEARLYYLSLVY